MAVFKVVSLQQGSVIISSIIINIVIICLFIKVKETAQKETALWKRKSLDFEKQLVEWKMERGKERRDSGSSNDDVRKDNKGETRRSRDRRDHDRGRKG